MENNFGLYRILLQFFIQSCRCKGKTRSWKSSSLKTPPSPTSWHFRPAAICSFDCSRTAPGTFTPAYPRATGDSIFSYGKIKHWNWIIYLKFYLHSPVPWSKEKIFTQYCNTAIDNNKLYRERGSQEKYVQLYCSLHILIRVWTLSLIQLITILSAMKPESQIFLVN